MEVSAMIVELITLYKIPAVFAGAFFFGDSVVITSAYLTGQLGWYVPSILAAVFLGTTLADVIWFLAGVFWQKHSSRIHFFEESRKKAAELLETFLGKNPLLAIIAVKFLYGTRIAMIVYVAARGMSFGTFALYNSIGTFLWLAVLFPLGYLTGKGLAQALPPIYAIQAAIVVLILSFIIMRMFSIWLTKRIGKKG